MSYHRTLVGQKEGLLKVGKWSSTISGTLGGGSRCHMSPLRKANVALSNL